MALWSFCKCELEAAGVLFIARSDSDNSSQLLANINDIIQAFDAFKLLRFCASYFFERRMIFFICHLFPYTQQLSKLSLTLVIFNP